MSIIDFLKTLPHVEPDADYLNAPDYYPYLNFLARDLGATRVLEVGVRFGYSAIALIRGNPITEYVGIDYDLYDAASSIKSHENLCYLKQKQPLNFTLFKKNTQELDDLEFLGPKTFDLIHIDGDHSHAGALTDLKNFWNVLAVGGHMLVDDSIFYGSVRTACLEFAKLIEEPFYDVKTYRGTWVFLKTRERNFPITRSLINEGTPVKPIDEDDLVKCFRATHTGWSGVVILFKDGTFKGGLNSPDGRWLLDGELLTLKWYHWPETRLKPEGSGKYVSLSDSDNLSLEECDPRTAGLSFSRLPANQERDEGAHSVNGQPTTPEPLKEEDVLRRFIAVHTAWSGIFVLLKDGVFNGGLQSPDGRWVLDGELLTLKWYHWPETRLKSDGSGGYVSLSKEDDLSLQPYDPVQPGAPISAKNSRQPGMQDTANGSVLNGGVYLNLGCGANILPPPWHNHDMDMDITKPLPFEDNSVSGVLVEHTIEHIDGPSCLKFLDECHRILKPGAVLRVCVPTIPQLQGRHLRDIVLNHGHCTFFCETTLRVMLRAAGFEEEKIEATDRRDCDGHWKMIGEELDRLETCRMEARK